MSRTMSEVLGQGMARFAGFLEARVVDAAAVTQPRLRKRLATRNVRPGG